MNNHGKHPRERMQGGMQNRISLLIDVKAPMGRNVIGLQRAGVNRMLADMTTIERRITEELARAMLPRAETASLIRYARLYDADKPLQVLIPKAISAKCAHDYLQFNTSDDSSPKDRDLGELAVSQRHPHDTQKNGAVNA